MVKIYWEINYLNKNFCIIEDISAFFIGRDYNVKHCPNINTSRWTNVLKKFTKKEQNLFKIMVERRRIRDKIIQKMYTKVGL